MRQSKPNFNKKSCIWGYNIIDVLKKMKYKVLTVGRVGRVVMQRIANPSS